MSSAIRIEITDTLGNISYLSRNSNDWWQLVSQRGIPLALGNVVENEPLVRFAIQDAGDDANAILQAITKHLSGTRTARLLSPSPVTSPKGGLTEDEKKDFAWILTETIDLSVGRRGDLAQEDAKSEFESIQRVLDYLERQGADMSVQRLALGNPRF
ncbi:hypothetical protein IC232_04325 [Microvirga sp. BT688]|uniref:hypothetical protein n=1 Tax=Microvirga sp. TaxID=1873136 RepID=UPI00168857DF|nr:hypothetical protein [Microvirga sp.]MBD2745920.1 hypothetical protein [Microvirga sp.]